MLTKITIKKSEKQPEPSIYIKNISFKYNLNKNNKKNKIIKYFTDCAFMH